ncbi:MAG: glutamate--tRNA ligase [Alphaproteobacteria bacterium]|nr:glutamate--tRNA ligase [Alphaproteobacteria bacterium]
MAAIVTRFAPSPTGMLHIGGVRTALINWLFARRYGGCYLVRIEDTDRKRSTPEAISAIEHDLRWLDLQGDAAIGFQSTRLERHQEVALQILDAGKAYRCQCSPEELDAMRSEARAAGRTRVYDRRCREAKLAPDTQCVVRLKVPTSGETVIEDIIQGSIAMENDHLDDYILLRVDGTPTYMLSCVVDDADMGISHVVRGDDHINNAFRQLQLIRAVNFPEPAYAHLPLLHGDDGAKLSKRHGALGIAHYQEQGYLPEALLNYLMRLGWGKGEEILSLSQAAEIFDLAEMSKAPAQVDFARLNYFNAQYIRSLADHDADGLIDRMAEFGHSKYTSLQQGLLRRGILSLSQRTETLQELILAAEIYLKAPKWPLQESKAEKQFLSKVPNAGLDQIRVQCPDWDFSNAVTLKNHIEQHVAKHGVEFGQVGQPLRIALTGTMRAPDISEIMHTLGCVEVQQRIISALEYAHKVMKYPTTTR